MVTTFWNFKGSVMFGFKKRNITVKREYHAGYKKKSVPPAGQSASLHGHCRQKLFRLYIIYCFKNKKYFYGRKFITNNPRGYF